MDENERGGFFFGKNFNWIWIVIIIIIILLIFPGIFGRDEDGYYKD